jgi:hypothetical protein
MKVTLPYQHHCTLYKVELTFCKGKALHFLEGPERIWFSISPPEGGRILLFAPSRQSDKLVSSRRSWDSPNPSPPGECAPPLVRGGWAHSLAREGVGESQSRRGDIHRGTLYIIIYMYFVPIRFCLTGSPRKKTWLLFQFYCFNPSVPGEGGGLGNRSGDACKWFASKVCTLARSPLWFATQWVIILKGTVRPDWICMRVVSLESPLKAHQPL